jgi:hypothetical protein
MGDRNVSATARFKYEFVRVAARGRGATKFDSYRQEIMDRARSGWRFVAAVTPPEIMTTSGAAYLDLVFEAPEDGSEAREGEVE